MGNEIFSFPKWEYKALKTERENSFIIKENNKKYLIKDGKKFRIEVKRESSLSDDVYKSRSRLATVLSILTLGIASNSKQVKNLSEKKTVTLIVKRVDAAKYDMHEVFDRFCQKYQDCLETLHPHERTALKREAESLRDHVITEYEKGDTQTEQKWTKLAEDLQAKGTESTRQGIEGKVFALSLKVALAARKLTAFAVPLSTHIDPGKPANTAPLKRLQENAELIICHSKSEPGIFKANKLALIVLEKLGEGTFNEAKTVFDLTNNEVLTLRRFKHVGNTDQVTKNWDPEVQNHLNLLRLKIPGIVKLYSIFRFNIQGTDIPYFRALLMEKCGGDLNHFIQNSNAHLTPNQLKDVFEQLLTSISAIGRFHLIHGDLKPANILFKKHVNDDGNIRIEVKLADFGAMQHSKRPYNNKGTPEYLPLDALFFSPNNQEANQKIDVWSLGLIIYELKFGGFHFSKKGRVFMELRDALANQLKPLKKDPQLILKMEQVYTSLLDSTTYKLAKEKHAIGQLQTDELIIIAINALMRREPLVQEWLSHFNQILEKLKQSTDPLDKVILGILDPFSETRWTAAKALQELKSPTPLNQPIPSPEDDFTFDPVEDLITFPAEEEFTFDELPLFSEEDLNVFDDIPPPSQEKDPNQ